MSKPVSAIQPQPIQIHPMAELHEALFQLGMLRNRNLILANENYALKARVADLEAAQQPTPQTPDPKEPA